MNIFTREWEGELTWKLVPCLTANRDPGLFCGLILASFRFCLATSLFQVATPEITVHMGSVHDAALIYRLRGARRLERLHLAGCYNVHPVPSVLVLAVCMCIDLYQAFVVCMWHGLSTSIAGTKTCYLHFTILRELYMQVCWFSYWGITCFVYCLSY